MGWGCLKEEVQLGCSLCLWNLHVLAVMVAVLIQKADALLLLLLLLLVHCCLLLVHLYWLHFILSNWLVLTADDAAAGDVRWNVIAAAVVAVTVIGRHVELRRYVIGGGFCSIL